MATPLQPTNTKTISKRRRFVGLAIYLYCIAVIVLEVASLIKGGIAADANGTSGKTPVMQMLALLFASLGFFFSGLFLLIDLRRNHSNSGQK